MTQDTAKNGPCDCGTKMNSMPRTCMGMMGRRFPVLPLLLAGALLIGLGALIVVEPRVVVWLLAAAATFAGVALLLMAGFMRRMRVRLRG